MAPVVVPSRRRAPERPCPRRPDPPVGRVRPRTGRRRPAGRCVPRARAPLSRALLLLMSRTRPPAVRRCAVPGVRARTPVPPRSGARTPVPAHRCPHGCRYAGARREPSVVTRRGPVRLGAGRPCPGVSATHPTTSPRHPAAPPRRPPRPRGGVHSGGQPGGTGAPSARPHGTGRPATHAPAVPEPTHRPSRNPPIGRPDPGTGRTGAPPGGSPSGPRLPRRHAGAGLERCRRLPGNCVENGPHGVDSRPENGLRGARWDLRGAGMPPTGLPGRPSARTPVPNSPSAVFDFAPREPGSPQQAGELVIHTLGNPGLSRSCPQTPSGVGEPRSSGPCGFVADDCPHPVDDRAVHTPPPPLSTGRPQRRAACPQLLHTVVHCSATQRAPSPVRVKGVTPASGIGLWGTWVNLGTPLGRTGAPLCMGCAELSPIHSTPWLSTTAAHRAGG